MMLAVYPKQLGTLGRARLTETPAVLPPFGNDSLHHLRAFDPFGMARRIEMVGESGRGDEEERHVLSNGP